MHKGFAAFDYELPADRIAQRPVLPYDAAKMLIAERKTGTLRDSSFKQLPELLSGNDLLVFNDSRVIPARLFGQLAPQQTEIELLLIEPTGTDCWKCLARPMKKLDAGSEVDFGRGLSAKVLARSADAVEVQFAAPEGMVEQALEQLGGMPIPPYIRKGRSDDRDRTDYQSIFAEHRGSIAAPTASLHFTRELIAAIDAAGCAIERVTLHVGTASFRPLWTGADQSALRAPASERFAVDAAAWQRILSAKRAGRRVIAVGTTVVRALETLARNPEDLSGATAIFIHPGAEFRMVDALITNFHQPRTTHMLLLQAFMGHDLLAESYRHALDSDYRFLSYGDGMFIN